jgi:hypothetical protein
VRSIKHGAVAISREDLEQTALSISQCEKIVAESREGETCLSDNEDSRLRLQTLLGIESRSLAREAHEELAAAAAARTRKNAGVGRRNPRRDPISVSAYES